MTFSAALGLLMLVAYFGLLAVAIRMAKRAGRNQGKTDDLEEQLERLRIAADALQAAPPSGDDLVRAMRGRVRESDGTPNSPVSGANGRGR